MIQSRFTGSAEIEFEFQRTQDDLSNHPTLFVSHVTIAFATTPTAPGDVRIYISDHEGEDLIWRSTAQNKTQISYLPRLHVPIPKDAKLILRYLNANAVEATTRFIWRV